MKMKFIVIKTDDVECLSKYAHHCLNEALEELEDNRTQEGKSKNTYIVINTDEPYADEVIEILKSHGHWG